MGFQFFLQGIFTTRGSTLPQPPIFLAILLKSCFPQRRKSKHPSGPQRPGPASLPHCSPPRMPLPWHHLLPLVAVHLPPLSGLTGLPTALSKQPPPCPPLFTLCPCPRSLSTLQYSLAYLSFVSLPQNRSSWRAGTLSHYYCLPVFGNIL